MIRVLENVELAGRNSFGVEARARQVVEFEDITEIVPWLGEHPGVLAGRWAVLGGGNNVLLTGDFDGTLLHITDQHQIVTSETPDTVHVTASAGALWDDIVAWSVDQNLWGAENLSGIPSSVGAAPVQNIGAYGAEVCEVIESVDVLDVKTLKHSRLAAQHCDFSYRGSIFKEALRGRVIIVAVNLKFSKHGLPRLDYGALRSEVERLGEPTPATIREAVLTIRNSKLPDIAVLGNAGSFFKNPLVEGGVVEKIVQKYPECPVFDVVGSRKKLSAGWLIEQSGWKGKFIGPVGIYEHQALIVVNRGGATGAEIVEFAGLVADDVEARFGVRIEPEVNIW